MKLKALVTAEIDIETLRRAIPDIDFMEEGYCKTHSVMSSEELRNIIEPFDILISEFETVDQSVIAAGKKLKLIICNRGGVRSVVDIEEAKKRGIAIAYNAGRNALSVSEIVMGYILDFCRNISLGNVMVRSGELVKKDSDKPKEYKDSLWGFGDDSPYQALRGISPSTMTLGIVGYGHVGREVDFKARAFGMNIIICDPMDETIAAAQNLKKVSLEELLAKSDVVTLHCPLTKNTKNMMNKEKFRMMKKTALFINSARGDVVDEEALIEALEKGEIAAAAIDVTKEEPILMDNPLLKAPNLTITPHIAGASNQVVKMGTEMTIHALMNWLGMELVM